MDGGAPAAVCRHSLLRSSRSGRVVGGRDVVWIAETRPPRMGPCQAKDGVSCIGNLVPQRAGSVLLDWINTKIILDHILNILNVLNRVR